MAANEQVIPTVGKAELNSEIKVEINTTPTGESATYSDMRKAFKSVTTAINEVVYLSLIHISEPTRPY